MDVNKPTTISIALCTYNGERFLQQQLDTIAAQTSLPSELVICDDKSADSTPNILRKFAATAPFPVKLHFNETNLGYLKNFEKAVSLCSGDIIAFSDQDDLWRPDKLAMFLQSFSNPDIGMAFSNAALIDGHGKLTGQMLWDRARIDEETKKAFAQGEGYKTLHLRNAIHGCTMAFRSKWWPLIESFPSDAHLMHDGWIALMTSLFAEVVMIDEPLLKYRLHAQQATQVERREQAAFKKAKGRKQSKISRYKMSLRQLHAIRARVAKCHQHISPDKQQYLSRYARENELHTQLRLDILEGKSVSPQRIYRELKSGRYHRFSHGPANALRDFLLMLSKSTFAQA